MQAPVLEAACARRRRTQSILASNTPCTNTAHNTHTAHNTQVVIDEGAVQIFVQLLASPSDDVREQAVWALGNIAGDSPRCRDLVLSMNALPPLLEQLKDNSKISMLRNATWTLSNFCRGKPPPDFSLVRTAASLRTLRALPGQPGFMPSSVRFFSGRLPDQLTIDPLLRD